MAKNINFGDEGRMKMFDGMQKLEQTVVSTLGPKGRNVIFNKGYGAPQVTNDGVTIAKEIELEDAIENMGASLLKEAASRTNDVAGDGTTTATLLAFAMIKEGMREIRSGINAIELKNGMKSAVTAVTEQLASNAKEINTKEEIAQVATISAQDAEVGGIIADAMEKVGKNGVITIEEGQTFGLEVEVTEGMKFDNGYISPYMVTDTEKMTAKLSDTPILITDKKISSLKELLPLLEQIAQTGKRDLTIIAEDIEGDALGGLIINKLKGALNVLGIKAPGFGDRKKEMLHDIAVLTGGTVVSDEIGLNFENISLEHLGHAKTILATKDNTTIIDGSGAKEGIMKRIQEIEAQIEQTSSSYDKEKYLERLAKLTGGIAVIRVGAASEIEMKEKKLRIEDALNATKAAVEEGIVAGGGIALLQASKAIESLSLEKDQQIGAEIIVRSLSYPVKQIAENSGKEGNVVIHEILKVDNPNHGYDAAKDIFVDMIESGIIDPKKVSRSALENAVSVAGMFLTTEAIISDIPKENDSPAMPPMGGWMGMPGMM